MTCHQNGDELATLRVVEQLPGAVVLLSANDFRIKYASEAYRAYLPGSFKHGDLVGVRFVDYVKDGENNPSFLALRRISESGRGEEIRDYRIKNLDGKEFWVDWVGSPIDNGTERWDVLLQPRDITDRKKAEETLKEANETLEKRVLERTRQLAESEARYRSVIESSNDAILLTGVDGNILSANPAACRFLGMTEEEIIQAGRDGIVVRDENLEQAIQERERTGRTRAEITGKRKDGTTFDCEITSSHFTDADGTTKTSMIIRDITERKRADEALKASEAKFRSFIEQSTDGVTFTDEEGRLIEWNKSLEIITGLHRDEVIGQYFWDVQYRMTPYERRMELPLEKVKGMVAKTLRTGQANFLNRIMETTIVRTDGETRHIAQTAFPIKTELGYRLGSINRDITAIKHAELELKESEERYRNLVETVSEGIWLVNGNNITTFVNHRMAEMMGYEIADLIGHHPYDFVFTEDKEQLYSDMEKIPDSRTFKHEHRMRRKDGSEVWLLVSSTCLTDNDGKYRGSLGLLMDITEHKRADEALKASEAKFRSFIEQSTDGVSLVDEEGRFIEWNRSLEEISGLPRDEVIGRYYWEISDLITSEVQKKVIPTSRIKEVVGEILRTGRGPYTNRRTEVDFHRPDGTMRTTSQTLFPIRTERGYRMGSIILDITDRKKAELSVEEERNRLQTVLDSLPVGVSVSDAFGRTMIRNKIMHEYLGDPVLSNSISDYARYPVYESGSNIPLPPEEMPMARALLREEFVSNEEIEIKKADGERAAILASSLPMRDKDGKIIGALGVFTDITTLKNLENDLKRSNAELQQFAYVASHDLREPLRMVSSYLDLLQKRYDGKVLDTKAKEYIHVAVDGADRMQQMINDLLTYSRIETRARPFSLVKMDDVLITALKDLKASIDESGASITHDPLPTIMADQTQMVLLLENLLSNAIKFRRVEAPQIHVSAHGDGREWVFSVRDNGIGIDPKQKDRLFQMFQRLHTRDEYPGTGIGLAIARRIVERHGGMIWFESRVGEGSTFFFSVPVRRADGRGC